MEARAATSDHRENQFLAQAQRHSLESQQENTARPAPHAHDEVTEVLVRGDQERLSTTGLVEHDPVIDSSPSLGHVPDLVTFATE